MPYPRGILEEISGGGSRATEWAPNGGDDGNRREQARFACCPWGSGGLVNPTRHSGQPKRDGAAAPDSAPGARGATGLRQNRQIVSG